MSPDDSTSPRYRKDLVDEKQHAVELSAHGTAVHGVAPTVVRREMAAHWLDDPAMSEHILVRIPLGRVAECEDVVAPPRSSSLLPQPGGVVGERRGARGRRPADGDAIGRVRVVVGRFVGVAARPAARCRRHLGDGSAFVNSARAACTRSADPPPARSAATAPASSGFRTSGRSRSLPQFCLM